MNGTVASVIVGVLGFGCGSNELPDLSRGHHSIEVAARSSDIDWLPIRNPQVVELLRARTAVTGASPSAPAHGSPSVTVCTPAETLDRATFNRAWLLTAESTCGKYCELEGEYEYHSARPNQPLALTSIVSLKARSDRLIEAQENVMSEAAGPRFPLRQLSLWGIRPTDQSGPSAGGCTIIDGSSFGSIVALHTRGVDTCEISVSSALNMVGLLRKLDPRCPR